MNSRNDRRGRRQICAYALEALESRYMMAASLASEIGVNGSNISGLVGMDHALLFQADDGTQRTSIWRSDGTKAGTRILHEFATARSRGGFASVVGDFNGKKLIHAFENNLYELWISDGTSAGTSRIFVAPDGYDVNLVATTGDGIYFTSESMFWKSNGTSLGLMQLHAPIQSPDSLVPCGDRWIFFATPNSNETLLYGANSDFSEITLLRTFETNFPAKISSSPEVSFQADGRFYFMYFSTGSEWELWTTDGTEVGTRVVGGSTIAGSSEPLSAVADKGTVYVGLIDGTIFKSDGAKSSIILDPENSGLHYASGLTVFRDGLLFTALPPGENDGADMFYLDFATSTARKLGNARSTAVTVASTAFFTAWDATAGVELWKTDGTLAGTLRVKDIYRGAGSSCPAELTAVGDKLMFKAYEPTVGEELWVSDGTSAGTKLVRNINPGMDMSSNPSAVQSFDGRHFFTAYDPSNGRELWVSDASGTRILRDIYPGPDPKSLSGAGVGPVVSMLTPFKQRWFFIAYEPVGGIGLWQTDGTQTGTVLVKQLVTRDAAGESPTIRDPGFIVASERMYFTAFGKLFRSDGTEQGTSAVTPDSMRVYGIPVLMGKKLYFVGSAGGFGQDLWSWNEADGSLSLVKDIRPGAMGAFDLAGNNVIMVAGKYLFFAANDGVTGKELWRTDGTRKGTIRVADLSPGSDSSDFGLIGSLGSSLLFTKWGDGHLWKTDGTPSHTTAIKTLGPAGTVGAFSPVNMNGIWYFLSRKDTNNNLDVWRSDGSTAGTWRVFESAPGNTMPENSDLKAADGLVFFVRYQDGIQHIVATDGTAGGAAEVALPAGLRASGGLHVNAGAIYLECSDSTHGSELYTVPVPRPTALLLGTVFEDVDGDSVLDSGEAGLFAWRVFIDTDRNGLLGAGERSVLTDSLGRYRFSDLTPGSFEVGVVKPSGWKLTTPATYSFTLVSGGHLTRNFGARRTG